MTTTPKTLSVTECHQLLAEILVESGTKKQFAKGIRNYTIALLMIDAGLRVGEVVQLAQTDLYYIDRQVQALRIRKEISKSKVERIVPLSTRICEAIQTMYSTWWFDGVTADWKFAFYQLNPSKHITTRQVERIIRAAAMKCLGRPIHPHILRHTFADRLRKVTDLPTLQKLLGHNHLSSTQVYMHPGQDDMKKAIDDLEETSWTVLEKVERLSLGADAPDHVDTTRTHQDH